MSELPAQPVQGPAARAITLAAATVLIATQTIALSVAGGWAVAGFLGLGEYFAYAFELAGLALGVWAVIKFVRSALKNDPSRRAA